MASDFKTIPVIGESSSSGAPPASFWFSIWCPIMGGQESKEEMSLQKDSDNSGRVKFSISMKFQARCEVISRVLRAVNIATMIQESFLCTDISPLLEKCDEPNLEEDPSVLEVVRLLDQACKEAGFFYVTGHGVSDSLIKQVKDVTHKFFELPIDEKVRIKMSSTTGFSVIERWDLGCMENLGKLWKALIHDLSRKIMRGIALALGGPVDAFEGLLTLVNQDDDITALQVRNLSGEWINAMPIPGSFVCNIGDMLKVLSNGLYEPTLHRVINNSSKYRTSIAFFYEPNFDVPMEPLDFCKQKTGGIAKFEKVIYGEHLISKVLTNFVM
ncbi:hypothetical protein Taro_017154 [Colocasia esculenta]|uniref:Fe2OG dioxygenase domain-containing protein n=1 Tax=Colocasia esculenta TaxID=4460 RepID=A0A843USG9_COLES|nr:hypothetical protein [Colocasia esculenta]